MNVVKNVSFLVMLFIMSISFISCGDDDEVVTTSIVGTWERSTNNQEFIETYIFTPNLRGSHRVIQKDQYGSVTNDNTENFEYELTENEGRKYVRIVEDKQSYRLEYSVTATKLLLYSGSSSYNEFKRIK